MLVDTPVLPNLYAFRPNRQTLGGTAYLLVGALDGTNLLVDCPATEPDDLDEIERMGGVSCLVLTHRTAIGPPASTVGPVAKLVERFACRVVIQEQEAYLLPQLTVTSFGDSFALSNQLRLIWTPGHTPGSSCLYWQAEGGVLFTGRHLVPDSDGLLAVLQQPKTFHWPRQRRNVGKLLDAIAPPAPSWICPGANLGKLRGKKVIAGGRQQLERLVAQLPEVER